VRCVWYVNVKELAEDKVPHEDDCRSKGHTLFNYGANFTALWCEVCERTVRDDWKALMGIPLDPNS
jgi:hypothetical protein